MSLSFGEASRLILLGTGGVSGLLQNCVQIQKVHTVGGGEHIDWGCKKGGFDVLI